MTDWELWACANQILQTHGENGPLYVAKQIGTLALDDDAEGIAAWQQIARNLSELAGLDITSSGRH